MKSKIKKLNKKNITELLVRIQNHGDLTANSIATDAVDDFGLQREHMRQTGNPPASYAPLGKPIRARFL